jgi:hypothetical protein
MSDSGDAGRRYWWVNQNQTHRDEVAGGFLWSPKTNANGARNQFYDNMRLVQPGDVIFSFYGTHIQAVGIATSSAVSSEKPLFRSGGAGWSNDGWLLDAEFTPLATPFRPKDHIALLRPHLPVKYSPLQSSGNGLQSVYLAAVPPTLARILVSLGGIDVPPLSETFAEPSALVDVAEFDALHPEVQETERERLIRARLGQGVFKANVRLREARCRVTGTAAVRHLRASHIKPWRASSNKEKLDGANGLLLAPHVDHLFDRGWISFEADGGLLVASRLEPDLLSQWGIQPGAGSPFDDDQAAYLDYHRTEIFQN